MKSTIINLRRLRVHRVDVPGPVRHGREHEAIVVRRGVRRRGFQIALHAATNGIVQGQAIGIARPARGVSRGAVGLFGPIAN